jgi:hypothetical protein
MAFNDALFEQGFVPAGATPQVIQEPGAKPGFQGISGLDQALRSLTRFQAQKQKDEEAAMEKRKNKMEMFKTLRESGYSSDKAFKAVREGIDIVGPPDTRLDDRKTQAEISAKEASTKKTLAEANKLEAENKNPVTSKSRLEAMILEKVANNKELTKGEQRIYDDVIKKKEQKSGGGLDFLDDENGEPGGIQTPQGKPGVNVTDPSGVVGIYDKALWEKNKQKLLRKGWRAQ